MRRRVAPVDRIEHVQKPVRGRIEGIDVGIRAKEARAVAQNQHAVVEAVMVGAEQQPVTPSGGREFAGNFAAQHRVIGLEVAVAIEPGQGSPVQEQGLATLEIALRGAACKIGVPVAEAGQQAPGVGEVML